MADDEKKEVEPEQIFDSYEFEIQCMDGTKETVDIQMISSMARYKVAIAVNKLDKEADLEDLGGVFLDSIVPELMERRGAKSLTAISLIILAKKLVDVEGDGIFGKGWLTKTTPKKKKTTGKKSKAKKKRGRPRKK